MNKTITLFDFLIRSFQQLIQRPDTDRDQDRYARALLGEVMRMKSMYMEEQQMQEPMQEQMPEMEQPMEQPTEMPTQPMEGSMQSPIESPLNNLNSRQQSILGGGEMKGNY